MRRNAIRSGGGGERGFAVLIVLWAMVLLSLVATRVTASGRSAVQVSANLRNSAVAEAAADGAVHEAIFRMLDPSAARWRPDGQARTLPTPGGEITLRLDDQAGKVNPNAAPPELLAALLRQFGTDTRRANTIAAAIADWRAPTAEARPLGAKAREYRNAGRAYGPPNAPFESIGELSAVLGMTPAVLEQLAPHLSLFYAGDPEPALASPAVLRALRAIYGAQETTASTLAGVRLVAVRAEVVLEVGTRFVRSAVVRVGAGDGGRSWQILAWGQEEE